MADIPADPTSASGRALEWLPPRGEWRELWFTHDPHTGPVPDEPILAGLEAAIAGGWAEGGEMTFGFNDDNHAGGARTMRAYRATPAGLRVRTAARSRCATSGTGVGVGEADAPWSAGRYPTVR